LDLVFFWSFSFLLDVSSYLFWVFMIWFGRTFVVYTMYSMVALEKDIAQVDVKSLLTKGSSDKADTPFRFRNFTWLVDGTDTEGVRLCGVCGKLNKV
jgi:hypothetical protein